MRPLNEQLAADILEEACRQFLQKGYSAVTVRSIASESVLQQGLFTNTTKIRKHCLMH